MDNMCQLSSMAFLKLGKFLLYVTVKMFLAMAGTTLGWSRSWRLESRALLICFSISLGLYPRSVSFEDSFVECF